MIVRRIAAVAVVALGLALGAIGGRATGLHLGCEIGSLDVTGTLLRVPVALSAASDALLAMLADQGLPPGELTEIGADFDLAIADVAAQLSAIPTLLPIPLLGGGVEIPLPWVVIDGIRLSGGMLDTAIVRGVADLAGVLIPDPLLDEEIDLGSETARFTIDLDLSTWAVSLEAVKRVDLFLVAIGLSAGVDYASSAVVIDIGREVPAEWAGGVDAALAALHLGDLRWSTFAAHVGVRLELGLPFLRLYADVRLVQPLAEWVGWWDLRSGGLAGSVGVVIRF